MDTQDKKGSILKAASSCFARYGYEKTTLDDIGKLVGLNKASLYYYYKSKENIYTEVIFYEVNELFKIVFEEVEKVSDCKGKILTYLSEHLKYIKGATHLNQLSMDSIQKITPLFTEMYGKIIEKEVNALSNVLDDCAESGEIIACDTLRVAKSIITVFEAVTNRIDACSPQTTEDIWNSALEEISFTVSLLIEGLKKK